VTLKEMGNVVIPTLRLRTLSFADVDPAVSNIVARNLADSVDARVQTKLRGGTQVIYSNAGAVDLTGPTNTVGTGDVLKSVIVDSAVSSLRGKNVIERLGNTFVGFAHPHVMFDYRREAGETGWRYPHQNAGDGSTANVWVGQTGVHGGVTWVETPRAYKANDGASSATVYRSYIVGAQALAEVVAIEPHVVIGPVTDKLARHRPLGWHGLAGWSIYRQEALYRLETVSTISNM
jgi:N4-gp56 family major capsid protein